MNTNRYQHVVHLAQRFMEQRQFVSARDACQELLRLNRKSPDALPILARIEWSEDNHQLAIDYLEKHVRLFPRDQKHRICLGDWLSITGQHQRATVHLEKAVRREPDNPFVNAVSARCHMRNGDNDRALTLLQPFIDTDREHATIANEYALVQYSFKNYDEAIRAAGRHLDDQQVHPNLRRELFLIFGRASEKSGQYEQAFNAANEIERPPWEPQLLHDTIEELIEVFSPKTMAALPRATNQSQIPVFITCLPRSGSTLVERIIDFCRLDWDDACLEFHTAGERAQKTVSATHSFDQVRQPMYTSSVSRAKPFRNFLDPLVHGLERGQQYWKSRDAEDTTPDTPVA